MFATFEATVDDPTRPLREFRYDDLVSLISRMELLITDLEWAIDIRHLATNLIDSETEETVIYAGPAIRRKATTDGDLFFEVPDDPDAETGNGPPPEDSATPAAGDDSNGAAECHPKKRGGRKRKWSDLEDMIQEAPDKTAACDIAKDYNKRFAAPIKCGTREKAYARTVRNQRTAMKKRKQHGLRLPER